MNIDFECRCLVNEAMNAFHACLARRPLRRRQAKLNAKETKYPVLRSLRFLCALRVNLLNPQIRVTFSS